MEPDSETIETRLWDGRRTPSSFDGVTVATMQSVSSALNRGEILPTFGLVMVDECHHALSPTFGDCYTIFVQINCLGHCYAPRGDELWC